MTSRPVDYSTIMVGKCHSILTLLILCPLNSCLPYTLSRISTAQDFFRVVNSVLPRLAGVYQPPEFQCLYPQFGKGNLIGSIIADVDRQCVGTDPFQ